MVLYQSIVSPLPSRVTVILILSRGDTMKKSVLLVTLLSGTALWQPKPVSASDIFSNHPLQQLEAPSLINMDKAYKTAAVCFMGYGDCESAGNGSYDSFEESLEISGSYLCENSGYKICPAGQIGDPTTVCPEDSNYFKKCKCNTSEMTRGNYNNNCGPLATVSTCSDETGNYYLCSCSTENMTKCNQRNELLLDSSQYCIIPKENTRWYGKNTCLSCTSPKVPNSSTKTCTCPTNYKVCTSPSVGVGVGCEDNGTMKYTSCECPADYVTCTWGPETGSASCNTGSSLKYKSCKPDPKTCDEWVTYVYGTPVDITSLSSYNTIFKDTHIATANLGYGKTTGVDYSKAPNNLCLGRTNPVLTIDKATKLYSHTFTNINVTIGEANLADYTYLDLNNSTLTVGNLYAADSISYEGDWYSHFNVTGKLTAYGSCYLKLPVNINNFEAMNASIALMKMDGYNITNKKSTIKNLIINGWGPFITWHPTEIGTFTMNLQPTTASQYATITIYGDTEITGNGIFISANGTSNIPYVVFNANMSMNMNNKPFEINTPGNLNIARSKTFKNPQKIFLQKGSLGINSNAQIQISGQICSCKTNSCSKTYDTPTTISSSGDLNTLICIPE